MRLRKEALEDIKKKRAIRRKNRKVSSRRILRPIFFKRNALDGGEVDWLRTSRYRRSPL